MSTCQSIDFLEKESCENEDFKSKGLPEPHIRSQNLICRKGSWEWHVKITFRGTMIREDSIEGFIAEETKGPSGAIHTVHQVHRLQFSAFPNTSTNYHPQRPHHTSK
jgi:hypothetical protein